MMSEPLPDGTRIPLLMVTHGVLKLLVREQGSCVVVFANVRIPDQVRKKLAALASEDKQRVLIALRGELSSNGRIGFSYFPAKFSSLEQLEAFSVEQLLKISEDDISCFNRFCDALQEVATITLNASAVFGVFESTQDISTMAVRSAPTTLYG
jgi:hypothetical protein